MITSTFFYFQQLLNYSPGTKPSKVVDPTVHWLETEAEQMCSRSEEAVQAEATDEHVACDHSLPKGSTMLAYTDLHRRAGGARSGSGTLALPKGHRCGL